MPPNLPQGQEGEPESVIDRFLSESADSAPGSGDIPHISSALIYRADQRHSHRGQLWNGFSRGLVTIGHLPDEVLVKILQLVDIHDLLNVSLVSHRWKCVVATESVWSVVDLGQLRTSNRVELNAVLSKSQRSLLTIFRSELESALTHRVMHDICAHIDRLQDLDIETDGWNSELDELMFGRPAPLLKSLSCGIYMCTDPDLDNPMRLPADLWPGANCRIESLALGVFSLSDTAKPRPITSLRQFGGVMHGDVSYARNLFAYFPNLAHLQLTLVTADCIVDLPSSFPNGLQLLELVCEDKQADLDNVLKHLPPSLRTLSMDPVHNIIPCLALMKRISSNDNWWFKMPKLPETVDTGDRFLVQLGSDLGLNFEFVFNNVSNKEWLATPDLFSPANVGQGLTRLEIPYLDFQFMRMQRSKIGSLTHLHVRMTEDLDLTCPGVEDEFKEQEAMRLPRLESIAFEVDGRIESYRFARWFARWLPQQLRNLVQFDAECLHTIRLVCCNFRKITDSLSFCCLGRVCREVVIRRNLSCKSHEACLDDSEVATQKELSSVQALSIQPQLFIDEDGREHLEYSITHGTCLCDTNKY
ncbi:hypothetical protein BKA62DRAFT_834824 [Auriculariales sp. MPI-PUGE-AT-0066]|nr:hypothetical protein BKA62DRAFT_834824 [Auriculariales sp. MPI-PUGE-AT-0066]